MTDKNSLVHRDDGGFPYSRDFGMTIKCENFACPFHGGGQCSSPSAVKIDSCGRCVIFLQFKNFRKSNDK